MLSRGRQALKASDLSLEQVVTSRLPGPLPGIACDKACSRGRSVTFHNHRPPRDAAVLPAAKKQLGPVTLAIRAMRAAYGINAKAPTRRPGPVTEAIRTMRAAVPDFDANPDLIALRRALANRIEADIAALDMLGGDPDAEPSLGAPEPIIGFGFSMGGHIFGDQTRWADGATYDGEQDAGEEREEENEHGGDIQDQPHDPQPDDILPKMHGWDPRVAEAARKARRNLEAIRARMARGRA